jgi:hypothetical protein
MKFIPLVLVSISFTFAAGPASANLCIPTLGGWFEECDPANGEPPSWCNDYPEGNWFTGDGPIEWVPIEIIWQRALYEMGIVHDGDDHDGGDPDGVGLD